MQISGRTRLVPIVGHPVAQVKTPEPINAWCAEAGVDAAMVPLDVPPARIANIFDLVRASANIVGLSITYPHKQAALAYADEVTPRCCRIGAVNTIRRDPDGRLIGEMTDGLAMRRALEKAGCDLAGQTVLLAGAGGGAGAAIADALCEAGIARLVVSEKDADRRNHIMALLAATFPDVELLVDDGQATVGLGINASPLGMRPNDPMPFDPTRVARDGIVADAVTPDRPAPLLIHAGAANILTVSGEEMADAQMSFQLDHWRLQPTVHQ